MEKADLRKQFKQSRLSLTASVRADKSILIVQRLEALFSERFSKQSPSVVHVFESMPALGEPDIRPFTDFIGQVFPGTKIVTPRQLHGQWLNVTPENQLVALDVLYDAVILPLLAFDKRLHRLGYGGGFYDRLLAGQPAAYKIGVGFDCSYVPDLPAEIHDVALDVIVTESQTYRR